MPVELTCRGASARPYAGALRADAATLLRILALEHCELSLVLTTDPGIRRLNREFLAKDQATDVLSFPQLDPARGPERRRGSPPPDAPPLALGDIVISIDTARRQARELGQATAARIRTLLIHGTLHLLGYDHERSIAHARRMFAREHELAALMLSAVTDPDERPPRSRPAKARARATASRAKRSDTGVDLRWSPAAMPARKLKAAKKSILARQP